MLIVALLYTDWRRRLSRSVFQLRHSDFPSFWLSHLSQNIIPLIAGTEGAWQTLKLWYIWYHFCAFSPRKPAATLSTYRHYGTSPSEIVPFPRRMSKVDHWSRKASLPIHQSAIAHHGKSAHLLVILSSVLVLPRPLVRESLFSRHREPPTNFDNNHDSEGVPVTATWPPPQSIYNPFLRLEAVPRQESMLTSTPNQPSQKTFIVKQKLAKKARQNRPLPQWFRLKTDSKLSLKI